MEKFKNTEYLGQLISMVDKAKKELSSYVTTIDVAVARGSKGSTIAKIEYLSTISELARNYKDFDLTKNIEQIINFFTISETVRSIQMGLLHESSINEDFRNGYQLYSRLYHNVLIESTNPSNYPHTPHDYDSKLVGIFSKQEDLRKQYISAAEVCKEQIFPIELLKRKSSQPYIDINGNQFSSILECIVSKIDISKDIDLSNNQEENTKK